MLCLEMIGCFSEEAGSQQFPLPLLRLFLEHLGELPRGERDGGPAGVMSDLDDDLHEQSVARKDRLEAADGLQHLGQFVENLLALEAREALELHVQDGL